MALHTHPSDGTVATPSAAALAGGLGPQRSSSGLSVDSNPVPTPATGSIAPSPVANAAKDDAHVVRSPFVGTFYRSPSPSDPPFVEVGQRVSRGQTLCIVEAMKLMNEIEAEVEGIVLEIVAENSKPVQYGEALFRIARGS
ncbi:MAG: acetyl-CoA carboxylase biotin carboxyl carrier protein [Deltaproteobacteria bacterium]|nr:acetyl-CoA carboxylase biotin carboxyl carrier protein [Deltaproteobacteria bacterium]